MPIELTSLSQSSLQDYNDCPRRFELRYLQRLAYPAIETEPALENEKHQREGEYFHRLVQQYFIGIPAEQVAKTANTDTRTQSGAAAADRPLTRRASCIDFEAPQRYRRQPK